MEFVGYYKKSMLTLFDNIKVIFVVDSEDDNMYTFKLTFGSSLISGDWICCSFQILV